MPEKNIIVSGSFDIAWVTVLGTMNYIKKVILFFLSKRLLDFAVKYLNCGMPSEENTEQDVVSQLMDLSRR